MGDQDSITLAIYAKKHSPLDKPGWKRFERMVETEKCYIWTLRKAYTAKSEGPRMKFGIKVPKYIKDVLRIDRPNGDRLKQKAVQAEIDQINEYNTFTDKGKGIPPPQRITRESLFILFLM